MQEIVKGARHRQECHARLSAADREADDHAVSAPSTARAHARARLTATLKETHLIVDISGVWH